MIIHMNYKGGNMKAFVLLANGFEEVEAITPIDVLRRAGIEVTTLSIHESKKLLGAHNVIIAADALLADKIDESADIIITPGGMPGSKHLKESTLVQKMLKKQHEENRYIASICASPIVLESSGVIKDTNFTCYPGFESEIQSGNFVDDRIVHDKKIVTAKGPGVAMEFSLKLVEILKGKEAADNIKQAMIVKKNS